MIFVKVLFEYLHKGQYFFFAFCNPGLLQLIKLWLVPCVPSLVRLFIPIDRACQDGDDDETGPVGGQALGDK